MVDPNLQFNLSKSLHIGNSLGLLKTSKWTLDLLMDWNISLLPANNAVMNQLELLAVQCLLSGEYSKVPHLLKIDSNSKAEAIFLVFYSLIKRSSHEENDRNSIEIKRCIEDAKQVYFHLLDNPVLSLAISMLYNTNTSCNDAHLATKFALNTLKDYPYLFEAWEHLGIALSRIMESDRQIFWTEILTLPSASMLSLYLEGSFRIRNSYHYDLFNGNDKCKFIMLQRALINYQNYNYAEAEKGFKSLIEEDPYSLDGLDSYSDILYLDQREDDLKVLMHQCMDVNSNDRITFHVSGNYWTYIKQFEKAAVNFKKAAAQSDFNCSSSSWILAAQQYLELRQPETSIFCYLKVTETDPLNYKAWYGLAQVYELLDSPTLALQYYFRSATLSSFTDYRVFFSLGKLYKDRNQFQKAHQSFEDAMKCPNCPLEVHLQLGSALQKMGQKSSLKHFRIFLDGNPSLIHSVDVIEDLILREAISSVAEDDERQGEYVRSTLWQGALSRGRR